MRLYHKTFITDRAGESDEGVSPFQEPASPFAPVLPPQPVKWAGSATATSTHTIAAPALESVIVETSEGTT